MNSVFEHKVNIKQYILMILVCLFLSLILTLGISLVAGYRYRVVSTDSMLPTIAPGSLIIEGKEYYEDLRVGDIITYSRADEKDVKITHRIIDIVDGTLKVKGDNPSHDQIDTVTKDNYIGKVIITIPNIRMFFDWLYNNLFVLLYSVVVLIVVYNILFLYN